METTISVISQFQSKTFELNKSTSHVDLSMVLSERNLNCINEHYLYLAYYNSIPNLIEEDKIDCKKAIQWLLQTYISEISDVFYDKRQLRGRNKSEIDDACFCLFEDLMVCFDTNRSKVKLLFRKTKTERIEALILGLKKYHDFGKRNKAYISLLYNSRTGIDLKFLKLTKPKLNIAENYNDDFEVVNRTILKRLSRMNDKGIVLLQGKSGTGKTTYIKHLIGKVKKKVIFLPPNMAAYITNPDLINIMINNPNSILVIEDAENIIMNREKEEKSPVSSLLNISDGLLSDCLNIQIICSFNTDISKIDTALMRKGRLIAKYEFGELCVEKAQTLSNKLGYNTIVSQPMTLTDIYNQEELDYCENQKRKIIGFEFALKN